MSSGDKRYLIGRRDGGEGGLLLLGRYLALDGSTGAPVYLDVLKPHAILICGKRGYGKSYTMGALVEEFARTAICNKEKFLRDRGRHHGNIRVHDENQTTRRQAP